MKAASGAASNPGAWLAKARQDARSARRLLADPPELEDAAYHVQQAAEKAVKALLVAEGIRYPRGRGAGHDLYALAGLVPADHPLRAAVQPLTELTPWATAFRYPVDDPLTAEPPPAQAEIARSLDQAEALIEAVAHRAAAAPGAGGNPAG